MDEPKAGGAARLAGCAVLAYVALVFGACHAATPWLVDFDSYFHARFAHLFPQVGVIREFPWMTASFWSTHFFDKDFLFHVYLACFTWAEGEAGLLLGAKLGTVALVVGIFAAFQRSARRLGLAWAPLWTFLLLSAGGLFLHRMLETRGHLMSVFLLMVSVPYLVEGRARPLFLLGFVYSWCYVAPHLVPCLFLAQAVPRWVRGGRFPAGALAASVLGVVAGLALHPQAPWSFQGWWISNVLILGSAWGLSRIPDLGLGAEFGSPAAWHLLGSLTGTGLAWCGGVLGAAWGRRAASERTLALLGLALAAFVLFAQSTKFVEYFAPLSVLFAASAIEDQLGGAGAGVFGRRWKVGLGVAAALLLGVHALALNFLAADLRTVRAPYREEAAAWLRANVAERETVMNLNWQDFNELFFWAPRKYLCGSDPTLMWVVDPEGAELVEGMRTGQRPFDAGVLGRHFGARYGFLNKQAPAQAAIVEQLRRHPESGTIAWEDRNSAIFRAPE
ncbi:MAG: hypothetical protein HZA54_05995 [Planctomycetes bacterium]|nr:hypothetical protein [Planctomycetota bacterium]